MAKSGRKKREKRKDFQKVKFKVGKKKPQADNVTVTTFKSQAIQIREQLKSGKQGAAEPTTQKKKNIHELLCHLNHYNSSVRQTSVAGMKELLSAHPALILQHLPILIDSLSVLMTDKEDMVRKLGISVLQLVLQSTPGNHIAPFFPVLSAHLSCAMTHLQEDIQLDSLAILDLVLRYYPDLLTAHSQDLLTIFVQLISQQRKKAIGWAESGDSDLELAVKPGSKTSSHRWRQKVLLRLRQFLTALLAEHHGKASTQTNSGTVGQKEDYTVIVRDCKKETYAPIYAPGSQAYAYKEEFVLSQAPSTSSNQDFTEPENLLGFVRSLVPLLLQCWVEVAPKSEHQAQTTLHVVAMEILNGVLSVILLLWRWMQSLCEEKHNFSCMAELQKLYHKKFVSHLLTHFPYASHSPSGKAKHPGKSGSSSASAVGVNLAACEVMSYFMDKSSSMERTWLRKIMAYVLEMCLRGSDLSADNMQSLLSVTRRLVASISSQEAVNDLLQGVFSLYESCHKLSANKRATLLCLDELLTTQEKRLPSSRSLDDLFLQSLPELIQDVGSQKALETLLQRASQRQPQALACIQRHLQTFLDPDVGIFTKLSTQLQVSMIHLIQFADPLDLATLKSLVLCCHDDRMSAKNVAYLINILSTRFLDRGTTGNLGRKLPFSMSDYVSFLFSVSLGSSKSALSKLHESTSESQQPPHCVTSVAIVTQADSQLEHCKTILKSVCLNYSLISSKDQMWDIVQMAISNLFECCPTLPCHAVYAILHTANYLFTPGTYWSIETLNKLTDCCLATTYKVVSDEVKGVCDGDWGEALWGQVVSLLATCKQVLVAMMEQIRDCVLDLTDPESLQCIATVIIRLLQTQEIASVIVQSQMAKCVMEAVQSVLRHSLATEDKRWVAELQYESSVNLKMMSG